MESKSFIFTFLIIILLSTYLITQGLVIDYPYDAIVITADQPEGVVVPSRQMILRAKHAHDLHENLQARVYIVTGKLGSGKTPFTDGMYTNLRQPGDSGYADWMITWNQNNIQMGRYGNQRVPGGIMLNIMLKSWGIDTPFMLLVEDPSEVGNACIEKGFSRIGVMGSGGAPEGEAISSLSANGLSYTLIPDYENGDSVYQWIVDSAWVQPFNGAEKGIPAEGIDVMMMQGYCPVGGWGGPENNSVDSSTGTCRWHRSYDCHDWDPPCHSNIHSSMVGLGRLSNAVNNFKQRNCKMLMVTGGGNCQLTSGERYTIAAIGMGVPPEKIFVDRWSGSSGTNCIAVYNMMKEMGYSSVMYTSMNGNDMNQAAWKAENGGILTAVYHTEAANGPEPFRMMGPLYTYELMSICQLKYGDLKIKSEDWLIVGGWVDQGEKLFLDFHDGGMFGYCYNLDSNAQIYLENAVTGESFEITDKKKYEAIHSGYIYEKMDIELYTPDTIPEGVYNLVWVNPDG
ncbi:MAG: hypothetical protein ABIA63_13105, partial [bacterium]